jgi:flagellar basal body P-ring formation protein FlgA
MKRSDLRYSLAAMMIILNLMGLVPVCNAAGMGEKEIKDAVKSHVEENAPWPKDRIRVEFLAAISEAAIPAGSSTCQVRSRAGESYIGRTSFVVRFCKGDTFIREETVRVRIEVLTEVVVSTGSIARDAIIDPSDVMVKKKWLDTSSSGVVSDVGEVGGKKAATRINAGTEITKHMLRSVPVVKKGEVVRIVLESGPMMISAMGLCEQDGGAGDLIRVQNTSSKKTVFARVIGASLVKVDF